MKNYFAILYVIFILFGVSTYPAKGQIDWQPYPGKLNKELLNQIEFGYLAVPENHDNPESRQIYMALTVIKSFSENPLPDPVVLLPGGPGYGFSPFVEILYSSRSLQKTLEKRDVILVDPRGCGYSFPALCENLRDTDYLHALTFAGEEDRKTLITQAMSECKQLLNQAEADVHAYNSVQVAHDLEVLRRAMGIEKWNVRGHSYGSYYGFVLLQKYPESVKSALLSGIVNTKLFFNHSQSDFILALRKVFDACNNDLECQSRYPNIEKDLLVVLQRLENEPIPVVVSNSNKTETTFYITPEVFVSGLYALLYQKAGIEILPLFIDVMTNGNDWVVENMAVFLLNDGRFADGISQEMLTIIRGNDLPIDKTYLSPPMNDPLAGLMKPEWLIDEAGERQFAWDMIRVSDTIAVPEWRVVDVPVLIVSGEMDPVTPSYRGDVVMQYFSNATHHIIPGSGHFPHADAELDYGAFLDNPDPNLSLSSITNVKPLRFITDISLNKGVSNAFAHIANKNFVAFVIPALALVISLIGFLFFPLRYLFKKIRRRPSELSFEEAFQIWLIPLLVVVFVCLLAAAIFDALSSNLYIISMGLPGKWDFIKYIILLLWLMLVYNVFTFRKVWHKPAVRFPFIICFLGGLGFATFALYSGIV